MNPRLVAKIGAFTAFSMLVGSVIGVGIFLKNNSVFRGAGYNPTNVIIAWVVASIICIFTALSYSEISLSAVSRLGIAKWAEKVGGKKLSYFIRLSLPIFYFGILLPGISYFAAEILLLNFTNNNAGILSDGLGKYSSIGLTIGVGTAIYLAMLVFNFISIKLSGMFQRFSLIVKFIPLLSVFIVGVVAGAMNNSLIMFNDATPGKTNSAGNLVSPIGFNEIIVVLPGILFAFDSFLNVGVLAPQIKNSKKTLPIVIGFGMIAIGVFYTLITVGQIMVSQGVSWQVFNPNVLEKAFEVGPEQGAVISKAISQTFYALILVSVLGVMNGFTLSQISLFQGLVESKIMFGNNFFLKLARGNSKVAGVYIALLLLIIWSIPYLVLSFVYNTDIFIDGITNFPTLFFFLIYGLLPLLFLIQKIRYKVKKDFKFWKFAIFASISAIGCFFVVFYQAFYVFLWKAFENTGASLSKNTGWGAFLDAEKNIEPTYLAGAIVFLVSLAIFFLIPPTNKLLVYIQSRLSKNNQMNKLLESDYNSVQYQNVFSIFSFEAYNKKYENEWEKELNDLEKEKALLD